MELWKHQAQALDFINERSGVALLAMGMGSGKSRVVIEHINRHEYNRVLIVCPKSVLNVWPKEFRRHSSRMVHVEVLDAKSSVAKKAEQLGKVLDEDTPLVVVVNYDSAYRNPLGGIIQSVQWDCVVADESHRIKSASGKASKFLANLGAVTPSRLALTGTPMPHSPLDVFAQYRFLDPSIFGTRVTSFKNLYINMYGPQRNWIKVSDPLRKDSAEEFERLYHSISFHVDTEDVIELPETQHIVRTCVLEPQARKIYDTLDATFVADLGDGATAVSPNALTKLLRLAQVTGGYVRDANTDDFVRVSHAKADLAKDILSDINEPVVIFARFSTDIDQLAEVCDSLKLEYRELSGKKNQLEEWQDGQAPVLLVQIQAGGVGIDLTRARYCIYYSVGYNLGDYLQSMARVHRPGQTRHVVYIHLIAENTTDEIEMAALQAKSDVVQAVIDSKFKVVPEVDLSGWSEDDDAPAPQQVRSEDTSQIPWFTYPQVPGNGTSTTLINTVIALIAIGFWITFAMYYFLLIVPGKAIHDRYGTPNADPQAPGEHTGPTRGDSTDRQAGYGDG